MDRATAPPVSAVFTTLLLPPYHLSKAHALAVIMGSEKLFIQLVSMRAGPTAATELLDCFHCRLQPLERLEVLHPRFHRLRHKAKQTVTRRFAGVGHVSHVRPEHQSPAIALRDVLHQVAIRQ